MELCFGPLVVSLLSSAPVGVCMLLLERSPQQRHSENICAVDEWVQSLNIDSLRCHHDNSVCVTTCAKQYSEWFSSPC